MEHLQNEPDLSAWGLESIWKANESVSAWFEATVKKAAAEAISLVLKDDDATWAYFPFLFILTEPAHPLVVNVQIGLSSGDYETEPEFQIDLRKLIRSPKQEDPIRLRKFTDALREWADEIDKDADGGAL